MKRLYPILFVFLLIFSTFSPAFATLAVKAGENVYTDIADGTYEIGVNFYKSGTNKREKSTAGDYMSDLATLKVAESVYELTLYNKSPIVIFSSFELEGVKANTVKTATGDDIIFSLTELKSDYESVITYEVPLIGLVHEGVTMDVELVGLENLPKKQVEPEPQPGEGDGNDDSQEPGETNEPGIGNDDSEESGETNEPGQPQNPGNGNGGGSQNPGRPPAVPVEVPEKSAINLELGNYTIEFKAAKAEAAETSSMARYLDNPAKVSVRDDAIYVTLKINDHKTVTGFQVEGKEPVNVNVDEGNNLREVTYKLDKFYNLHEARVQYTVATPMGTHEGNQPLRLIFDQNSVEQFVKQVELNKQVEVEPGQVVQVPDQNVAIEMPVYLPLGTKIEIVVKDEQEVPNTEEGFKVAGAVIDVKLIFPNSEDYRGDFTLTLPYDKEQFSSDQVDIYYYNETTKEWEKQNGTVDEENGTITVVVNHFSTYGVLAAEDTTGPVKVCENGEYIVPIEVLKADEDVTSVTNDYIKDNQAKLIVEDGKFKVQVTVTSATWWQYFKILTDGQYKDVRVISEDTANNERVVEFDIDNPNEIILGKVHIIVTGIPGFEYDNVYDIRIKLDVSGLDLEGCDVETEAGGNPPAASGGNNNNGGNGSNQQGPDTVDNNHVDGLTFDRNADGDKNENNVKAERLNPKTSDLSKIGLYVSLIILSLIPLVIKLRTRFSTVN